MTETEVRKYSSMMPRTATPLNQEKRVSTGSLPRTAKGTTSSTAITVCTVPATQGE